MKNESIVAEIKVTYTAGADLTKKPRITQSLDSYNIFRDSWDPNLIQYIEQLKMLLLTKTHHVLGLVHISTGGVSGTVADPKLIFGPAIKTNASGIILCHNHPSGCLQPSLDDIKLTQKIIEGARVFDMILIDHLIISQIAYFSMVDKGLFKKNILATF